MKCANPNCQNRLVYLRGGSLRLLELECSPASRLQRAGGGFPVYSPSARYFWLCPECSRILVLKRWTSEGLILESRPTHGQQLTRTWTVPPNPAVGSVSTQQFRSPSARSA